MNDSKDLLNELEIKLPQKTKTYYALIISITGNILFFSSVLFFDSVLKPFSLKRNQIVVNWEDLLGLLMFFVLPVIGFPFLLSKKKIGWSLCLTYYIPLSIFLLIGFGYNIFRHGFSNDIKHMTEILLLTLSALISMILLLLKNVRQYFNIQKKQLRITLGVSSVLTIVIIILFLV